MPLGKLLAELRVDWRAFHRWRDEDPEFARLVVVAYEHFAECEADRLLRLHEEFDDAKMAAVALKARTWWLEARNRRFRPKSPDNADNQPQLLSILQMAVARLVEQVPPAPALPLLPQPAEPAED